MVDREAHTKESTVPTDSYSLRELPAPAEPDETGASRDGSSVPNSGDGSAEQVTYAVGWRLYAICFTIALSLFLVALVK